MKKCEFLVTTHEGQVLAGTVTLDGKTLSSTAAPGHELAMANVMKHWVIVDDKRLMPQDDPEKWFANLPREYDGSYFRAGIVPDSEA